MKKAIPICFLICFFLFCGACDKETKGLKEEVRVLREENNFLKAENIALKKEIEELYKKIEERAPVSQKKTAKEEDKVQNNIPQKKSDKTIDEEKAKKSR